MSNKVNEPMVAYNATDDNNALLLISAVRKGLAYSFFENLINSSSFTLAEWADFLHLSPRSIQRYKKEKKAFDPIHSEKILQISMLYKKGEEVFGEKEKFNLWLEAENVALGGRKPKSFLDSSFGIEFLKDELGRIEHGIFA